MKVSSYADKTYAYQTTIDNLEPDIAKYPGVSELFNNSPGAPSTSSAVFAIVTVPLPSWCSAFPGNAAGTLNRQRSIDGAIIGG